MIQAWRGEWHANTAGQTDASFPFGFVQLSSWGDPANDPTKRQGTNDQAPVAVVRWAQRTTLSLPNTFMASVMRASYETKQRQAWGIFLGLLASPHARPPALPRVGPQHVRVKQTKPN